MRHLRGARTPFQELTTDILASGATITDFDPGQEDRIELNVISTHLDEDDFFREAPGPTPRFIGESTDIGVDEVGYSTVERSDGSVDTVITYRFLATGSQRLRRGARLPHRARGLRRRAHPRLVHHPLTFTRSSGRAESRTRPWPAASEGERLLGIQVMPLILGIDCAAARPRRVRAGSSCNPRRPSGTRWT